MHTSYGVTFLLRGQNTYAQIPYNSFLGSKENATKAEKFFVTGMKNCF